MPQPENIAPLPTFFNGIPLSAHDLNKLSSVQEFIYYSNQRWNVPFERWYAGDEAIRYLRHTHRYLHYNTHLNLDLTINANNYGEISGDGYIDLHPSGTNPYGMTYNKFYGLQIEPLTGGAFARIFYEWPVTGINLNPDDAAAAPTFTVGSVVPAAELNKISTRLQYLLDNYAFNPVVPFPTKRVITNGGSNEIYFVFRHVHRYVYFSWLGSPDRDHDHTYKFQIREGDDWDTGTEILENDWSAKNGPGPQRVTVTLDMEQGTNHVVHEFADDPTGADPDLTCPFPWPITMPAKGGLYTLCFKVYGEGDAQDRRYALCEVPFTYNYLVNGNYGLKDDEEE